eukprot:CAMPEP_0118863280 /NCGR_PEP_ID=MMETSP1163-20130328/8210_1 /TAXON_ID=124430 /ORGANISM="Phaeomonas parva, Strain CCMP2877" /LENGTH=518 /DNA_ID=CAMNT_0006797269 /DNA_START=66 /DNA_END=1622 /DNA_ORIENTATION=+
MSAHDSDYLKRTVGDALVQGMTKMVVAQPDDAVEFLGHFLLNYVKNKEAEVERLDRKAGEIAELEEKIKTADAKAEAEAAAAAAAKAEAEGEEEAVVKKLSSTEEPLDEIKPALELVKKNCGAGAVYLGVKETMEDGKVHIRFVEATEGSCMKGKWLEQPPEDDEENTTPGMTFNAFKEFEAPGEPTGEEEEGEEPPTVMKRNDFLLVPNVVRQKAPAMKFFGVPRLGQYLAVPFTHRSFLHEDGVDVVVVEDAIPEGKEDEEGAETIDQALSTHNEARAKLENVDYVLCMDTMGVGEPLKDGAAEEAVRWSKVILGALVDAETKIFESEKDIVLGMKDSQIMDLKRLPSDLEEVEKEVAEAVAGVGEDGDAEIAAAKARHAASFRVVQKLSTRFKTFSQKKVPPKRTMMKAIMAIASLANGEIDAEVVDPNTGAPDWHKLQGILNNFVDMLGSLNPEDPQVWQRLENMQKYVEGLEVDQLREENVALATALSFADQTVKLAETIRSKQPTIEEGDEE